MKKTILSSIIGLSLIFILLMSATLPSAVAYAVDGDVAPNYVFDKIDVAKDLEGSDGFDFADYPADASKDTQIYTFLEYGYDGTENSKFGLYLYIYNPQQKDFSRSSASNKANVAVENGRQQILHNPHRAVQDGGRKPIRHVLFRRHRVRLQFAGDCVPFLPTIQKSIRHPGDLFRQV